MSSLLLTQSPINLLSPPISVAGADRNRKSSESKKTLSVTKPSNQNGSINLVNQMVVEEMNSQSNNVIISAGRETCQKYTPTDPEKLYGKSIKTLGEGGFGKIVLYPKNVAVKHFAETVGTVPFDFLLESTILNYLKRINAPHIAPILRTEVEEIQDKSGKTIYRSWIALQTADTDLGRLKSSELEGKDTEKENRGRSPSRDKDEDEDEDEDRGRGRGSPSDKRAQKGSTKVNFRDLLYQTADAINGIHRANILHRDIKPGNILIQSPSDSDYRGSQVWLADFGIAVLNNCTKVSQGVSGTPGYMAPEVVFDQGYSYPADVWSYGILLSEIWQGQYNIHSAVDLAYREAGLTPDDQTIYNKIADPVFQKEFLSKSLNLPKETQTLAIDLFRRILVLDPAKRLTMEQVLNHPYFQQYLQQAFLKTGNVVGCSDKISANLTIPSAFANPEDRIRILLYAINISYQYQLSLEAWSGMVSLVDLLNQTNTYTFPEIISIVQISLLLYMNVGLNQVDLNRITSDFSSKDQMSLTELTNLVLKSSACLGFDMHYTSPVQYIYSTVQNDPVLLNSWGLILTLVNLITIDPILYRLYYIDGIYSIQQLFLFLKGTRTNQTVNYLNGLREGYYRVKGYADLLGLGSSLFINNLTQVLSSILA